MTSSDNIIQAYRNAEPKRALGGIRALGGFNFQIRVHLATFIEGMATGSLQVAGEEFVGALFETLSDATYSDRQRGHILLQVKRTLTRRSLTDAAVEFAHIENFLHEQGYPHLPAYEVVYEKSDVTQLPDFHDLTLPSREVDRTPSLLNRWSNILKSDRFLGARCERDPWWRLISAAAQVIDRPYEFARHALDLCLSQTTGPDSAAYVRDQIAEAFLNTRRSSQSFTQYLTDADFTVADATVPLLVGKTATLEMLRQWQYMLRPGRIALICNAVSRILHAHEQRTTHSLDVFWIAGPSGSGKSVILLQAMQEMVNRGYRSVWLKGSTRTRELYPMLNSCGAAATPNEADVEIVFIDDLYDPLQRDSLRLAEVADLVAHNRSIRWPVVVTCGPPEIESEFDREFGHDAINVSRWKLLPVDSEEARQLIKWFKGRTTHQHSPGRAFEQEQMLMVSLAVELQHGDLAAFARNFRSRLLASDLVDSLRMPLALNRLYIWAPAEWLTDAEWERLDFLNQAGDFSIIHTEDRNQRFIRLTHPHISDVIYRQVREYGNPRSYASDLASAFQKCLPDHILTARNLIRVFAGGHERLTDIDERRLAQDCAAAWRDLGKQAYHSDAKHIAEIWVAWAEWNSRCPQLELDRHLGTSSINMAREAISRAGVLHTVLWQRLLVAYPDYPLLIVDGIALLFSPTVRSSPGWSYVWEALVVARNSGRDFPNVDLVDAAMKWIPGSTDNPGWSFVVQRLLDRGFELAHSVRVGLDEAIWEWLSHSQSHPSWQFVWEKFLDASPMSVEHSTEELELAGIAWLHSQADHPSWNYVWKAISESPRKSQHETELAALAAKWLPGHMDSQGWSYVLQGLLAFPDLDQEQQDQLHVLAFEWLDGREDLSDWNFVIQELIEKLAVITVVPSGDICTRALNWLAEKHADPAWNYVWQSLINSPIATSVFSPVELAKVGADWLLSSAKRDGFSYVAPALLRFIPSVDGFAETRKIQECTSSWLRDHQNANNQGWLPTLEALVDSGFAEVQIDRCIVAALAAKSADPKWGRVVSKCLCVGDDPISNNELAWALAEWLRTHSGRLLDLAWLGTYIQSHPECLSDALSGWVALRGLLSDRHHVIEQLKVAKRNAISVKGVVVNEDAEGYLVDIGVPAICKATQISNRRHDSQEPVLGQEFEFAIVRVDSRHGKVELSRRKWLDRMERQLLAECRKGDLIDVDVRKLTDHAAFAEWYGISVRIKQYELSWQPISHPSDVVAVGNSVRVKVLKVSRELRRIDASLRDAGETPWDRLREQLRPGCITSGKVVDVTSARAIVALECGITGFARVHDIANAQWVGDATLVLEEHQPVTVRILAADSARRRLLLAID